MYNNRKQEEELKRLTLGSLIISKYSFCIRITNSRTHEQVDLQVSLIESSSEENELLRFPDPEDNVEHRIPGEKSQLDFFLKRLDWIFNLNVKSR
ncbi:hypothetical protein GQ457_04G021290 [Hibiscus cannabinus]